MTRRPRLPLIPPPVDADVEREVAFHLDETRRQLEAEGWPSEEARVEAERRFGDRRAVAEACRHIIHQHRRSTRRSLMIDDFLHDLRFGARMLRRQPRAAMLAVLTMGLGIGAVSALFTLVSQVVLAPLPYARSEAIVDLAEGDETGRAMPVSAPNFVDWHEQASSFEAMAAYGGGDPTLVRGLDEPLRAVVTGVSGSFFQVFAARPRAGRLFTDTEPLMNGAQPAVVSEGFWRRHLGAEPAERLAARALEVFGLPVTVIGVVPSAFRFPEGTEMWMAFDPPDDGSGRTAHNWRVVARTRDGVDREAADAEMDTIASRLAVRYEGDNDAESVITTRLRDLMVGPVRRPLFLLLAASGLLLLLACANLTSDLMARATSRQQELAIRAAVGAGRRRILRQLLSETLLVHVLGAVAGVGAAFVAVRGLVALRPAELVRLDEVGVDGRVLVFSLLVALVTGLVFGLAPALSGSGLVGALGGGGRGMDGRRKGRVFDLLIAGEATLSLVLLVGAALLLRSFLALTAVDFGFRPEGALTADLLPPAVADNAWSPGAAMDEAEQARGRLLTSVLEAVAAVPGAGAVGLVSEIPLRGRGSHGLLCVDNHQRTVSGHYRVAGGSYFEAMGIPLLAGRVLDDRDRWASQPTVVISQRLANDAWPGEDAIGKQLCSYGMDHRGAVMATVVGVVGDVRHHGPTEPPPPTYYLPMPQRALRAGAPSLVIRTPGDPSSLIMPVRAAIAEAAPDMPVVLSTLNERLAEHLAPRRFSLTLVATFALVALALAASGIYGVVAYGVSRRRREVGIRLALGAKPGSVVRSMLARTLAVVGVGLAAGGLLTAVFGRSLSSLIPGAEPMDGLALGVAAALLTAVAAAACWLPARHAARVDPTTALRSD